MSMTDRGGDFDDVAASFPTLRMSDVTLAKDLLGQGGYCDVSSVQKISIKPSTGGRPLALKRLRSNLPGKKYETGMKDLMGEVRLLGEISKLGGHPNIITLHAIGVDDGDNGSSGGVRFIVLDQLSKTLKSKIEHWRAHQPGLLSSKKAHRAYWLERVQVMIQIVDAVQYFHSIDIIHRDLNIDNIGLDQDGTPVLFDFGLARKLDPDQKVVLQDDNHAVSNVDDASCYEMTGKTGTMRFMAPEVAWGKPYGLKADVYSLSIIMYHVLAHRDPWKYILPSQFSKEVIKGKYRPDVETSWPADIQILQQRMWHDDWTQRPTSSEVLDALNAQVKSESVETKPKPSAFGKLFSKRTSM